MSKGDDLLLGQRKIYCDSCFFLADHVTHEGPVLLAFDAK